MRKINVEKIENKQIFEEVTLSKVEVENAIKKVIEQIDINLEYFKNKFPAPATKDNIYPIIDNIEWTDGFYTGMLNLAYEYTKDEKYRIYANKNVESFYNRIQKEIEVEHHDLGFLYSPSCVGYYKLTKDVLAKNAGLMAAEKLIKRYQSRGKFIQAWGPLDSKEHYRFIIDCMLNIPLLYWASNETNDKKYKVIADNHFRTSLDNVIRSDASAYHTFYMDYETREPLKGVTRQGYNDSSSWGRGQAWGIYGIALNYMYTKNEEYIHYYHAMTNYFINRMPSDDVVYWDLIFKDGDGHLKDSSASAIAICGIAEMLKHMPETFEDKRLHQNAANRMLKSLINNYHNKEISIGSCVLLHGVYSWHSKKGYDEGNIWGDYFYFEALMRYYKDLKIYW